MIANVTPPTVPARDELVREFVSWVREALADDEIAEDDNFLDVGGHSMMAIQMRARLREVYGIELDLAELFQRPMQAALARHGR